MLDAHVLSRPEREGVVVGDLELEAHRAGTREPLDIHNPRRTVVAGRLRPLAVQNLLSGAGDDVGATLGEPSVEAPHVDCRSERLLSIRLRVRLLATSSETFA